MAGMCYVGLVLDLGLLPRPLSRAEYDRLVLCGALNDQRVELVRGEVVEVRRMEPRHAAVIRTLNELLVTTLAGRATVQVRGPLAVSEHSEPEPDLAVIERGDYWDEHPRSALLVVEVAEAAATADKVSRAALYAGCGVAEYWAVNLAERVIVVHRRPENGSYGAVMEKGRGESIALVAFPAVQVVVAAVV